MRDVKTLIKMQKLYVDEQRRVLADKQRRVDAIEKAIADLIANMDFERQNEAASQEGAFLLGAFIKKELARKHDLENALVIAKREIEVEREKLAQLFEELKRFEIVQENWDEEEKTQRRTEENLNYDEQAGTRHQRAKDD
jgi:flagellar export protein FliJ